MKKLIQIIFLSFLVLLLSGCMTKNGIVFPRFKAPSIDLITHFRLDRNLPPITQISAFSSIDQIALKWKKPSDQIAGYRIFRLNPISNKFELIKTIRDAEQTNFVDKGLNPNTVYVYKISSYTKDGRVSVLSKAVKVKTKYNLDKIQNLKAISNLPRKIKLTWDLYKQNELIKYYSVYRSPNGKSTWQEIDTIHNSLAVEYIDHNIIDGKTYFYYIKGYTYSGIPTPSSDIVKANSKPLPKTPINLTATTNEARKIKVAWFDPNKDSGRIIVKYNIYTSPFKHMLFMKHASTPNNYFIDKVPADGKVIYYKVTAVDKDGLESPKQSKPAKGMTRPNPPAPTITEYKIVDSRVIIKWLPPTKNIVSYIVIKHYYNKYFIPKTVKIVGIKNTIFVDKNIQLGKTYKYQIIGVDKDGIKSKPSYLIEITVKEEDK